MNTIPKHVAIIMDGNGRWGGKLHAEAGVKVIMQVPKRWKN